MINLYQVCMNTGALYEMINWIVPTLHSAANQLVHSAGVHGHLNVT